MSIKGKQFLHTGEVVGSIPTTPTIKTPENQGFPQSSPDSSRRFETQRSENMTAGAGENPGTARYRAEIARLNRTTDREIDEALRSPSPSGRAS